MGVDSLVVLVLYAVSVPGRFAIAAAHPGCPAESCSIVRPHDPPGLPVVPADAGPAPGRGAPGCDAPGAAVRPVLRGGGGAGGRRAAPRGRRGPPGCRAAGLPDGVLRDLVGVDELQL